MFTNRKSSLLRQHTVNQYLFVFTEFRTACYLVLQPYFERNLVFVSNGVLVNLPPPLPPPRYMYTQARPSGESLSNYVVLLWVDVGQPCTKLYSPQDIDSTFLR